MLIPEFKVLDRPHEAIRGKDAVRDESQLLNTMQKEYCCAFYDAGEDRTVALFGGSAEQFFILSVARHLRCNVVIFSSEGSYWFQGSATLPPIEQIGASLASGRFKNVSVLFGQSSGGYGALAASKQIPGAVAVAVSPQTFDDREAKGRMRFSTYLRPVYTDPGLLDLKKYLSDADQTTMRAIMTSASEYSTPYDKLFWVDHLHSFRMIDVPTVEIFMLRVSLHSSVYRNAENYGQLLAGLSTAETHEVRREAIFSTVEVVSAGAEDR